MNEPPGARARVGLTGLTVAEYFREPDAFLGLLAMNLSMGQWLCMPMIVGGALLWAHALRAQKPFIGKSDVRQAK